MYFLLLGISKIEYKPDGGPGDNLCFKHYNPQEVNMLFKSWTLSLCEIDLIGLEMKLYMKMMAMLMRTSRMLV